MKLSELLAAAKLRETEVEIEGQTVRVREPTLAEYQAYRNTAGKAGSYDDPVALASLLKSCILDPVIESDEAALAIANGRGRVGGDLLIAILDLAEMAPAKKKGDSTQEPALSTG